MNITGLLLAASVMSGFPETNYVETSVARGEIRFVMDASSIPDGQYVLKAHVAGCGEERDFVSGVIAPTNGVLAFVAHWNDASLWDTDTPSNRYVCTLRAEGADINYRLDAPPFEFGFREVVIDGRDILLNGRVIHLRALHNRIAVQDGGEDPYAAAEAQCRRILADGFNFIIMSNYDFHRDAFKNLDGLLKACDETGLLMSFSLPHEREFGLVGDPGHVAAYRDEAAYAISLARNHPSVILYAANHNICGYTGDMNPLRIDGLYELEGDTNRWRNAQRSGARVTRGIVRELDPTRPMYHHESGNLDDFHTINCYLNWAPKQERSDWFAHWSEEGVKPLFLVEWGLPHISSWSSYRGPQFIWRCNAYQSLWASEYAAMFHGDNAYEDTPAAYKALDREESLWTAGRPFMWGQLCGGLRAITNNYLAIQADFAADNWRSMRAWGVSAMLPWDQEGIYDSSGGKTILGRTFDRWNMPECAFIGGGGVFTDKRHIYRPSETVTKQLVILNDTRRELEVGWNCRLENRADGAIAGRLSGSVVVAPGGRALMPVEFRLPAKGGSYALAAEFKYPDAIQCDRFNLVALAEDRRNRPRRSFKLYDPVGLTRREFVRLGIGSTDIPRDYRCDDDGDAVVIGRQSLDRRVYEDIVRPVLDRGGKVLVFEQSADVLEDIGFRIAKYGLRNVFPRGGGFFSDAELLRDWSGEATLLEPYLGDDPACEVEYRSEMWCGFRNTRVWRCRNRGNVASVLIEKPTRGDWLALCDGGFDLQYAPLLKWSRGDGVAWFCQLDVTARTEPDPAADEVVRRLLREFESCAPTEDGDAIVLECGDALPENLSADIAKGRSALCLGFTAAEVASSSPYPLACAPTNGCHFGRIASLPPELDGLSNADWAWHGAMDFDGFQDRVPDGNAAIRVVRHGEGRIVFWQLPPERIDCEAKPYLRTSRRRAEYMLNRLKANLGIRSVVTDISYADTPQESDDPYRYYRW